MGSSAEKNRHEEELLRINNIADNNRRQREKEI